MSEPDQGEPVVEPSGEPVEPSHAERVQPWWRVVDQTSVKVRPDRSLLTMPKTVAWPLD